MTIYELKKLTEINPYGLGQLSENRLVKSITYLDEYVIGIHKVVVELPNNKNVALKLVTGNSTIEDYYANVISKYENNVNEFYFYSSVKALLEESLLETVKELEIAQPKIYDTLKDMVQLKDIEQVSPFLLMHLTTEDRYLILTEKDYNKGVLF